MSDALTINPVIIRKAPKNLSDSFEHSQQKSVTLANKRLKDGRAIFENNS